MLLLLLLAVVVVAVVVVAAAVGWMVWSCGVAWEDLWGVVLW